MKEQIILAKGGKALPIILDESAPDYKGLRLITKAFSSDVKAVSGASPEVYTINVLPAEENATALIAGSLGHNKLIDSLVKDKKLSVTEITGKREVYTIAVVDNPCQGINRAIVVAGSDKRGTIYGIFHISELIGVSPWIWWADVRPVHKEELLLSIESLTCTSKEPSVKYRGFFINDEWPSFGSWSSKQFGGFNEDLYAHVFELILRLKGNYLWPAMWSSAFSRDGKSNPLANAELADTYGIVMGTSHHEPLFRAGNEWQKVYEDYGESNEWNFSKNSEAITKFWKDGVKRNKDFESVITVGMRGEADSALGGGLKENIDLLKNIITVQRKILNDNGLADTPKMLTVYKEVENYWYGKNLEGNDKTVTEGLDKWTGLDDVTIMLCEDNFGNMRTLPRPEERNRKAGWGMYYHVDYHGAPNSYEWINTMQLEKMWEQMSMAYDYGVKDIWILNVGDLKPMELPLSYFLDLAYDFDRYGTSAPNTCRAYIDAWVMQQFGDEFPEVQDRNRIADLLVSYTKLNTIRKPEITFPNTFTDYDETERIERECLRIMQEADAYYEKTTALKKDAFYELVYFPAVASANVKLMNIYAGRNDKERLRSAIQEDTHLSIQYNNFVGFGKWKGMMSSNHIGYIHWNDEGWKYPEAKKVIADKKKKPAGKYKVPKDVPQNAYLQKNGIVSIESEHTSSRSEVNGVRWLTLDNYGRTLSAVKMYPDTVSFTEDADAPCLVYTFYIHTGGKQTLTLYTAPTNNLAEDSRLRLGISFDNEKAETIDTLSKDFKVSISNGAWSQSVKDNIHKTKVIHELPEGVHTIKITGIDAGLVLEKLVLADAGTTDTTYLGEPESEYKE